MNENYRNERNSQCSVAGKATHRRNFIASSGLVGIAAQGFVSPRMVHAAGSDMIKVGLIGCGGRGTGAATNALQADPNVKLVAMGDAFQDRLELSLEALKRRAELADKIDVPQERQFVGFDAYRQVIASGVDVVLLCTPPHFRPLHLQAAVDAGKHVFAEKPVAVDAPGVRKVLATCSAAKAKRLSIVSGLCLRYHAGFQEAADKIHAGELGEIHTLQANDFRGGIWVKPRKPEWTDMHWQMRNWYYFTWLSGDFNVEQHIHFLDVCIWMMNNEYPVKAIGMGGRTVRSGEEFGNIYDHHSVIYEFASGARLFSNTRQMPNCAGDMSAQVVGSKGRASLNERQGGVVIDANAKWVFGKKENDIYQTEHDDLFKSIRLGEPVNHGEYMAKSTLLAIMGRMATYTGKSITWEAAMNSQEDLSPPAYEWGPLATPAIALPGISKFA